MKKLMLQTELNPGAIQKKSIVSKTCRLMMNFQRFFVIHIMKNTFLSWAVNGLMPLFESLFET